MSIQDELMVKTDLEQLRKWASEQYELLNRELSRALLFSPPRVAYVSKPPSFDDLVRNNPLMDSFFSFESTAKQEQEEERKLQDILSQFNRTMMRKNNSFWAETLPPTLIFFKLSLASLNKLNWPIRFKLFICQGLMALCYELALGTNNNDKTLSRFARWLEAQLKTEEPLPHFAQWQQSYAAFIFFWSNVFEEADAKKGLTMLPCFGLPDAKILYFGQAILYRMQRCTMNWLEDEEARLAKAETHVYRERSTDPSYIF